MNQYHLEDIVDKYYDQLEKMIKDFSSKCIGGGTVTINFLEGSVTISLK